MQGTTWMLDSVERIGGHAVQRVGRPQVVQTPRGPAVQFDGVGDGLIVDANPLANAPAFTLEAIFRPDAGGPAEQRFVHLQASDVPDRLLLETRLTARGWYADTFICSAPHEWPLNDPALLHPLDQWHALAMVCDGREMVQYVNGQRELATAVQYRPLTRARTALGMRINGVYPFRGALACVRFTPAALPPADLLRA